MEQLLNINKEIQSKLEEANYKLENAKSSIEQSREMVIKFSEDMSLPEDVSQRVNSSFDVIEKETKKLKNITSDSNDVSIVSEATSKIEKATADLKSILENFGKGKDKLLDDWNIQILYDYLDSLTLLEESAFIHIVAFLLILGCTFSIISVFFGNEVIRYFDLENKYPKLHTYLKIRATFQRYYLIWNIFIIIAVSIISLLLNLLVLY